MTTPRIRSDLRASPAEEKGVKYFDIRDPRSGAEMRLYDFEWLIAERMDGERPFTELAAWTTERFAMQPSAADLEEYAKRLAELGFFQLEADDEALGEAAVAMAFSDRLVSSSALISLDESAAEAAAPSLASSGDEGTATEYDAAPALQFDDDATHTFANEDAPEATHAMDPTPGPAPTKVDRPVPPAQLAAEGSGKNSSRTAATPAAKLSVGGATKTTTASNMAAVEVPADKKKSGIASLLGLLAVVVLIGGVVGYVKFIAPNTAAHVTTQLAVQRDVVKFFDDAAVVKQADTQTLSFGEAGKVVDVVAQGTEVRAGAALATLESYAKIEKDLSDVRDRETFYEKQLQAAFAKNAAPEVVKKAESKVAEKKRVVADLEARAAKVRLVAPNAATVVEVRVTAGGEAKSGEPAVKLGDKRALATFRLPPKEASTLKVGATAALEAAGGVAARGRIAEVDAAKGRATIEVIDDSAKAGATVRLVKTKLPHMIAVPAAAVVRRDGADIVFVSAGGLAQGHKVTIIDRTPTEAIVSAGLNAGDSVITSLAETLHDAQKILTE